MCASADAAAAAAQADAEAEAAAEAGVTAPVDAPPAEPAPPQHAPPPLPMAPPPPPPRRRLLLLCQRAADWRQLAAAAAPGVVVVPFSHECVFVVSFAPRIFLHLLTLHAPCLYAHRHGTLDALLSDIAAACARSAAAAAAAFAATIAATLQGADAAAALASEDADDDDDAFALSGGVVSVAILSHFKPGAVGLVRGARLSGAHVAASPPVRAFLARAVAALHLPSRDAARHGRPTLHLLHFPAAPGDAASAALLQQLSALTGCVVAPRASNDAARDAIGDLYFTRGGLREWEAAHAVPFAPSARAGRRRAGAGESFGAARAPLRGAEAEAEAATRAAAVRAYRAAAEDAAEAHEQPLPQRMPPVRQQRRRHTTSFR